MKHTSSLMLHQVSNKLSIHQRIYHIWVQVSMQPRIGIIGVTMDLQTIIWNLFKVSSMYFPCQRKTSLVLGHTSGPKKQYIKPMTFIFKYSFLLGMCYIQTLEALRNEQDRYCQLPLLFQLLLLLAFTKNSKLENLLWTLVRKPNLSIS